MIKKKEDKINIYINRIPQLENILDNYSKADTKLKNELLSSVIKEIKYTKTNKGGRWNKEAMYDFRLDIEFKI